MISNCQAPRSWALVSVVFAAVFALDPLFAQSSRSRARAKAAAGTIANGHFEGKLVERSDRSVVIATDDGRRIEAALTPQTVVDVAGPGKRDWLTIGAAISVEGVVQSKNDTLLTSAIVEVFPAGYANDKFETQSGKKGKALVVEFRGKIASVEPFVVVPDTRSVVWVFPDDDRQIVAARQVDEFRLSNRKFEVAFADSKDPRIWVNFGRRVDRAPLGSDVWLDATAGVATKVKARFAEPLSRAALDAQPKKGKVDKAKAKGSKKDGVTG